jgi:fatty acyl-CoA reductase
LQIVDIGKTLTNEIALDKQVWAPGGNPTYNRFLNYLKVIFFHILPALLIDFVLKLSGRRPL